MDKMFEVLPEQEPTLCNIITQMVRIRKCPPWFVVLPWTSRWCELEHEEALKATPTFKGHLAYPNIFSFGAMLKNVEGDHARARAGLRDLYSKIEKKKEKARQKYGG